MAVDNSESTFLLYTSWVNSLRVSLSTPLDPEALVNCRSFAEVLHRVDDKFFMEDWVEKVADFDRDSSWRLKGNNLIKLTRRMSEYLEESAARIIKGIPAWTIDEQKFVELHDYLDMNKVFCLIVGCAFMGNNKEEFVELIQQQPKELQSLVMTCVMHIRQNSEEKAPLSPQLPENLNGSPMINGGNGDSNGHHNSNQSKLIKELNFQIDDLKLDKERLEKDLEQTKQELYEHRLNKAIGHLEAENNDLRKRKEEAEDRLVDMEARIETIKGNLEDKELELAGLKNKMDQIHTFEEEYRKMRDEVGELKNKELELVRVTRELESLKQRNKDAVIDKTELHVLREKSAEYVKDKITLDDERMKNKALRQQIASLKAQKEETEGEANKAAIRLSKLESELAETKGRLAMAEKKNDDLVHEKLQLQAKVRDLEHKDPLVGMNSLGSELENVKSDDFVDRSRLLELEKQVDSYREQVRQMESLEQDQNEWKQTKDRNRELESELQILHSTLRESKSRIAELEAQLENPQSSGDVHQLRIQLEQQNIETKTFKERLDQTEKRANCAEQDKKSLELTIAGLKAAVEEKNDHLKKAQKVIQDQEHRMNSAEDGGPTVHQVDTMRKEIERLNKEIKQLREQLDNMHTSHEEESRLCTSAFYEMGQNSSRSSAEPGAGTSSFLKSHSIPFSRLFPWSLVLLLFTMFVFLTGPLYFRDSLRPAPLLV